MMKEIHLEPVALDEVIPLGATVDGAWYHQDHEVQASHRGA